MISGVEPIVRHIKPLHHRSAIGIDTLTFTPIDSAGNQYAIVIVNLFTKHCKIYPTADKTAETLAQCLFYYFVTYGKVDEIHSDPGSDLTSGTTEQLEFTRHLPRSHGSLI